MAKAKTPKQYKFTKIADLDQLPLNKIRHCLYDLELFLRYRKVLQETTGCEIQALNGFSWIDDGRHDFTARLELRYKDDDGNVRKTEEIDFAQEMNKADSPEPAQGE